MLDKLIWKTIQSKKIKNQKPRTSFESLETLISLSFACVCSSADFSFESSIFGFFTEALLASGAVPNTSDEGEGASEVEAENKRGKANGVEVGFDADSGLGDGGGEHEGWG